MNIDLNNDDLLFFGAGKASVVNLSMSSLIKKIGDDLNLVQLLKNLLSLY